MRFVAADVGFFPCALTFFADMVGAMRETKAVSLPIRRGREVSRRWVSPTQPKCSLWYPSRLTDSQREEARCLSYRQTRLEESVE